MGEMNRDEALERVRAWLADGRTWIGGFENADLSHPAIGQRVLVPFDDDHWDRGVVGKSTAPDGKAYGLGWRYLLDVKTRDAEEAVRWMRREEEFDPERAREGLESEGRTRG